jgi:hypothetical protein
MVAIVFLDNLQICTKLNIFKIILDLVKETFAFSIRPQPEPTAMARAAVFFRVSIFSTRTARIGGVIRWWNARPRLGT